MPPPRQAIAKELEFPRIDPGALPPVPPPAEIPANLFPDPADDFRSNSSNPDMTKRILSIDDSRMVHRVIAKTLRPLNIEVITAVSAQEGIEKAEQEQPDLILLDTSMPMMDGIEALVALKANPAVKDIPVIMLSTDPCQRSDERARQLGAAGSVHKPFAGDDLVAGLSAFLDLGQKAA